MTDYKRLLIFLLTAVLLIAGAFLPQITGAITDQMCSGRIETAPIQSVQLQLGSTDPADSIMRKLSIRSRMNTIPITSGDTAMTEEEVYAAVEECMDKYVSAGIFSWFKYSFRMAEPHLAINPYHTDEFYIFWAVNIVREDDPYSNLFLHLDDETGQILYMDYVTYDPEQSYSTKDQAYVLETLADTYFSQLKLTEAADPALSDDVTVTEKVSGDVWCRTYRFTDTKHGDFAVEFYVKPKGFYILFP